MPPLPAPPAVVRLRPVPAYDPPYDDEQRRDRWDVSTREVPAREVPDGEVEVRQPPRASAQSSRPVGRAPVASGPAPGTRHPVPAPPTLATGRSSASPAARLAVARFLNTCLEIFNGLRPVGHARQLAHPLYAQDVLSALTYATRRLRYAARRGEGRAALVKVRRLRVCEPSAGTVEIAAAIGFAEPAQPAATTRPAPVPMLPPRTRPAPDARPAPEARADARPVPTFPPAAAPYPPARPRPGRRAQQRTWAAAFRLERHQDRWQCTAAAIL